MFHYYFNKKAGSQLAMWTLIEAFFIALTLMGFYFVVDTFNSEEHLGRVLVKEVGLSSSALSLADSYSNYSLGLPFFTSQFVLSAEKGKIVIYSQTSSALEDFLFEHSYVNVVSPNGTMSEKVELTPGGILNIVINSKGKLTFKGG